MATATKQITRCGCGKRISQYSHRCKACDAAQRAERYAALLPIIQAGKCPACGAKLRANLSITGWWQCEQLGAEGFRKDSSKPSCDWQEFLSK